MTIKTIIAIAALTLSVAASAQVAVLSNEAGGSIVLTSKPSSVCGENQRIVYSSNPNGQTIFGCWFMDEVMVHIKWDDGAFRSYPANAFTVIGGSE